MSRKIARQLAAESIARGDYTGWFESLYAEAGQNHALVPWADLAPNPNLVDWGARQKLVGDAKKALVIGCGYGDDAEFLANLGFEVTAFDISPTAIAECQRRFPDSPVTYVIADLLAPPEGWRQNFDFILEAYTLQVLPAELRGGAIAAMTRCVAPSGQLLVITRGREASDPIGQIPYPLTQLELEQFEALGLTMDTFEDYVEQESSPVRRFRVLYQAANV